MHFHNFRSFCQTALLITSLSLSLTACNFLPLTTDRYTGNRELHDYLEAKIDSQAVVQNEFEEFCLSVFQDELEHGTTLDLHYTLLHPERYGIEAPEPTLGSYSLQEMIESYEELEELKTELLKFDRSILTEKQQITYDALEETVHTQMMGYGLELYDQPLAPTIGVQAQLPILLAEYSFHSLKDVNDYLALVEQIDAYYRDILIFENQKADAGLAPSDATIDAIIESCEGYLALFRSEQSYYSDPSYHSDTSYHTSNFLTESFRQRLETLKATVPVNNTVEQSLISRHEQAIKNHFIPAYELLIEGMAALKGRGINEGGLAGFQNGKSYYEYLVKCGPASSYSVPELKDALTKRMNRELEALTRLYTAYPDLEERISNASFSLTDPKEILESLKVQMAADFPALPDCDYRIRYVPKALEPVLSPAFYLTAPLDDTDQNSIYINNSCTDSTDSLYTTLAHEGFPGHLYQTVFSRQNQLDYPLLSILTCSGINEGWATYVEYLSNCFDNGLPEGVGEYYACLRSYSLCVHGLLDIGIHYDGWDRRTADAFVTSCFQVDEETLEELWQMILDTPTNYLDYCGGFVEIMEMREEAENTLGDRFSAKDFHLFLLETGPVPFSVIRTRFAEWLQSF